MRPCASTLVALFLVPATLAAQGPPTDPAAQPSEPARLAAPETPAIVPGVQHRLLAANRTSTLERELNAAAGDGYRLAGMMGGGTAWGGDEVVALMSRPAGAPGTARWEYRVLATNRTSTMQAELQAAGDEGFELRGQTIYRTVFSVVPVVVVILEREVGAPVAAWEYRLLATSRTSTLQNEISAVGVEGFELAGLTVAGTLFGGPEVVAITRRPRPEEPGPEPAAR